MIFVVGEEVRKNREGISEARTQHSIVAGIETNLKPYLGTTEKRKTHKKFCYFFGTPPTRIILSPNELRFEPEMEIYL